VSIADPFYGKALVMNDDNGGGGDDDDLSLFNHTMP